MNGLKVVTRGTSRTIWRVWSNIPSILVGLRCIARKGVNRVLELFAMYVEQWVVVEKATAVGGGVPDRSLQVSTGKCTVITVADPVDSNNDSDANAINKYQSWKSSYFLALRSSLQDVRVLKVIQKIDGAVYNLNVYREEGVIYFDAYDPVTSKVYISTLKIEDAQYSYPKRH